MFASEVLIIFAVLVVSRQTFLDGNEYEEMFLECARIHGGTGLRGSPEKPCTYKCYLEKVGIISGGKIVFAELGLKEGPWKECFEKIEIKECADVKKYYSCFPRSLPPRF